MENNQNPAENGNGSPETLLPRMSEQYLRILQSMVGKSPSAETIQFSTDISTVFTKAVLANWLNPVHFAASGVAATMKMAMLGEYAAKKFQNQNVSSVAASDESDMRFQTPDWDTNLWFDITKQSYLIGAEYLEQLFSQTAGLSQSEVRKLEFYLGQIVNALSPSNFAMSNPEVLKAIQASKGECLVAGLKNFADDVEAGSGIRMVNDEKFQLGSNIAVSPGKVVARNKLAELIQYSPVTDMVCSKPVMIIPPWINKYYILDLSPKNSFIRWLTEQGYTVFMVSWVNPDSSYRSIQFEDYLQLGPLWAGEIILSICNENKLNAIGYCLGGTLLSVLLGYLAARPDSENFVASATFLTAMIDFSEPGDLGVFVDEKSVSQLESQMSEDGYLDGKSMASTFNMMRSNDLIWHFVINNYLLGKSPGAFDLLYWNSDSTRMPANMHSYYLRNMYLANLLCQKNGLVILDELIDLSQVKTPSFFISTEMDHIAPWKSTFAGAKLFSGPVRFLLGQSGHIAGIINPPAKNKYGYWNSTKKLPLTADEWLERADRESGSWWPRWEKWLKSKSGTKITARTPGSKDFPVLGDAPGTYVKM